VDNTVWMFNIFNISAHTSQTPPQVDAELDDGFLTILIWRHSNRFRALQYLVHNLKGVHLNLEYITSKKACAVSIEPLQNIPFNIDGELYPPYPITITCLHNYLTLMIQKPKHASGVTYL